MRVMVRGQEVYASTGGRKHVTGRPGLIFLHGSGQSHISFTQQSRRFAYDGYNVLSPDFPGHGLSEGEPIKTIEEMADWVIDLMNETKVGSAHVVGHSQGCLVALELASRYADRVIDVTFIAGASAIPVNDALVNMAEKKEPKAIAAMMAWGSGAIGHKFDNTVPGGSHIGAGTQLMAGNARGALAADLNACNAYQSGMDAAQKISCPTLCILAAKDRMTPLKAGKKLAETLKDNRCVILEKAGHMVTTENPDEVNGALRRFFDAKQQAA